MKYEYVGVNSAYHVVDDDGKSLGIVFQINSGDWAFWGATPHWNALTREEAAYFLKHPEDLYLSGGEAPDNSPSLAT